MLQAGLANATNASAAVAAAGSQPTSPVPQLGAGAAGANPAAKAAAAALKEAAVGLDTCVHCVEVGAWHRLACMALHAWRSVCSSAG